MYPVKVTVIQDGNPLEGAAVTLIADGQGTRFSTGGITDKNGVATIKTDAEWPGAPAGKYKVCISKVVSPPPQRVEPSMTYEDIKKMEKERAAQMKSTVPPQFSKASTTPLSLEVTSGEVTETFDIGIAVEDQM